MATTDTSVDSDSDISRPTSSMSEWDRAYKAEGIDNKADMLQQMNLTNAATYVALTSDNKESKKRMGRKLIKSNKPERVSQAYARDKRPMVSAIAELLTTQSRPTPDIPSIVVSDEAMSPSDFKAVISQLSKKYSVGMDKTDMWWLIKDIADISQRSGMSPQDIKAAVMYFSKGRLRSELHSLFKKNMPLFKTLETLLCNVAPAEDTLEAKDYFYRWEIREHQDPAKAMDMLYAAGLRAFPDDNQKVFEEKIKSKVLNVVSRDTRRILESKERARERLIAEGLDLPPYEFKDLRNDYVAHIGFVDQPERPKREGKGGKQRQGADDKVVQEHVRSATASATQGNSENPRADEWSQEMQNLRSHFAAQNESMMREVKALHSKLASEQGFNRPPWMQPSPAQQMASFPLPSIPPLPPPHQQVNFVAGQGQNSGQSSGAGRSGSSKPPPPPGWGVHRPGTEQLLIADKGKTEFKPPAEIKQPSVPMDQPLPYVFDPEGRYQPTCGPFQHPVTRGNSDGTKTKFTTEMLQNAKVACLRCNELFCSYSDPRCLYYDQPNSFHFCNLCKRGFHTPSSCRSFKSPNEWRK